MQRDILVPLDGSPAAETVLPHAIALAQATGSALTVLQVIATSSNTERPLSEQRRRGLIYVAYVADRLRELGLPVHTNVVEGDPAPRIIARTARQVVGGMLVMVTHGRRGPSRWVFGSVAEAVIQAAPVPVLLVRRHAPDSPVFSPMVYTSLLVPLDGSSISEQALDVARKLARASGAVLHLLTVVDSPAEGGTAEDAATGAGTVRGAIPVEARGGPQWIVGMLQRTAQRLEAEGLKVQSSVEYGKPAEEILRVAAAINTDMVVMATHGRTGLERMWFGSVAMEVMRRLDRAVLLVRPPSRAQPEQQVPASS